MPRRAIAPEFQMREDHSQPNMRPSVDHLISQLRRHKALTDHPDAVVFVIKDLSHRFLVREDQRPDLLWQTVHDLMFHFEHLMPPAGQDGFDWVEEQMDNAQPNSIEQRTYEDTLHRVDRFLQGNVNNGDLVGRQVLAAFGLKREGVGTGGNEEATLWTTPIESSVIRYTPKNTDVNFSDDYLKQGIQDVILRHRGHEYVQGKMKCRCGKFFSTPEEWAKHLRVRIW